MVSGGHAGTWRLIREKDSTESISISDTAFSRYIHNTLTYMDICRHDWSQHRRLAVGFVGCSADP